MKHKMESRFLGEITITSDMQMTQPLCRKRRETKEPLLNVKEESEKVGLKVNIHKTEIMASGPIQFSHSGVSDSLGPHELQHARHPCPSPTPGVHSNSCPSSW